MLFSRLTRHVRPDRQQQQCGRLFTVIVHERCVVESGAVEQKQAAVERFSQKFVSVDSRVAPTYYKSIDLLPPAFTPKSVPFIYSSVRHQKWRMTMTRIITCLWGRASKWSSTSNEKPHNAQDSSADATIRAVQDPSLSKFHWKTLLPLKEHQYTYTT